jgi:hypothetical protein
MARRSRAGIKRSRGWVASSRYEASNRTGLRQQLEGEFLFALETQFPDLPLELKQLVPLWKRSASEIKRRGREELGEGADPGSLIWTVAEEEPTRFPHSANTAARLKALLAETGAGINWRVVERAAQRALKEAAAQPARFRQLTLRPTGVFTPIRKPPGPDSIPRFNPCTESEDAYLDRVYADIESIRSWAHAEGLVPLRRFQASRSHSVATLEAEATWAVWRYARGWPIQKICREWRRAEEKRTHRSIKAPERTTVRDAIKRFAAAMQLSTPPPVKRGRPRRN